MFLNSISPNHFSKKKIKRVGRGASTGKGKTCGRGHKGQKSRSGGYHKRGFEGGQMPFHIRLPKFGFISRVGLLKKEVNLSKLCSINSDFIDINVLKENNVIQKNIKRVKVIFDFNIDKVLKLKGILVSKKVREIVENVGGSIG